MEQLSIVKTIGFNLLSEATPPLMAHDRNCNLGIGAESEDSLPPSSVPPRSRQSEQVMSRRLSRGERFMGSTSSLG